VPQDIPASKPCSKCGEDKPLSEYHTHLTAKYGRRPDCKVCVADRVKRPPRDRYHRSADPLPAERQCVTCGQAKPLTEEYWYRHDTGGFRHECVACRGVSAVLVRYGVTREQYAEMLRQQGGGCAICGGTDLGKRSGYRLSIDHCHGTNRIRGLLCATCNLAIGYLRDDPELCRQAAAYLEQPAPAQPLFADGVRASLTQAS
jgi:hypothetical protein